MPYNDVSNNILKISQYVYFGQGPSPYSLPPKERTTSWWQRASCMLSRSKDRDGKAEETDLSWNALITS